MPSRDALDGNQSTAGDSRSGSVASASTATSGCSASSDASFFAIGPRQQFQATMRMRGVVHDAGSQRELHALVRSPKAEPLVEADRVGPRLVGGELHQCAAAFVRRTTAA